MVSNRECMDRIRDRKFICNQQLKILFDFCIHCEKLSTILSVGDLLFKISKFLTEILTSIPSILSLSRL